MQENYEIGSRLFAFLIARFGNIDAAARALGVTSGALYPYMDPKGKKQKAGKPLKQPGAQLMSRLASVGCDIHWLITGQNAPAPQSEGNNSVPSTSDHDSSDDAEAANSIPPDEARDMIHLLSIMGVDSVEKLRKFFDPETLLKDIVAFYMARFRPPGGR